MENPVLLASFEDIVSAEIFKDILKDNGVDISYIKKVREKNGHAVIQVAADGENSIFINSGSNTMVDSSASTRPLWRGMPNLVAKSLCIRAMTWILTFSI